MTENISIWDALYQRSQEQQIDQQALSNVRVNVDFSQSVAIDTLSSGWVASPAPGVLRMLLERDGGEKTTRATSVVSYQSGSHFSSHMHPKGEEFFVLSGTFSDENGDYPAGTYVRNPPTTSHQPFSQDGCMMLVKLQQFDLSDRLTVVKSVVNAVVKPEDDVLRNNAGAWHEQVLFEAYERVVFLHAASEARLADKIIREGAEILVVSGSLSDGACEYAAGHWLRFARGSSVALTASANTQLWVKSGHIPR